ncbi:prephenate dehydratase [Tepidibacillus fermentans]|uniref:Prephenate dehydratase n=1 Tax=Tepidibacillus fermentans TaxID=1281767 RepID=A0A4R3KJB1_9BACI|nr:prephenate dehydratase [Tepidibacillus fermentans]TCS83549.1 prephenate dehydratase [Tepidibacillus fermentans]
MSKKIAFLGPHGTFTEEAAHSIFENDQVQYISFGSIPDVLDAVAMKKVDYAVVPLENSIEGSVNLTLDWIIHEMELPILAELVLPIAQHLFVSTAQSSISLSQIQRIYSHPQAIAQCRRFIHNHLTHAEIIYTNSTAEAAETVSENPEKPWAAIGTRLAKELYSLTFLKESIEDYKDNYTRFIVVGENPLQLRSTQTPSYRTMILVTLPKDYPGALYQVLAAFAWRKINLSRIESRPTKKGLGNYYFIIDIEQKMDDVLLPGAFAEIEALGCQIRILGSYPYDVKTKDEVHS